MTTADFFAYARERHAVYLRRQAGEPRPWTTDPVLQGYRFCNVYRELDTVTDWIRGNWREPHAEDPDVWFAMAVARFVNWPPTLADVGYPVPWRPKRFVGVLEGRRRRGLKVYSGAYMIRSDREHAGTSKATYQAETTLGPLWTARANLRPRPHDTLNSWHMLLGQFYGMGSFMAAQVVADVKYLAPLRGATDWWTFAASGPGSRRGLNRVLGRPKDSPWTEEEWRLELGRLREQVLPMFRETNMPEPHAQDCQNLCCEWDKYQRVRLGEGRPRAKFNGSGVAS